MDFSVIEHLAEKYECGELCGLREDSPEQKSFYEEFVKPAYKMSSKSGDKLETALIRMLEAEVKQAFSEGFKVGIRMMTEAGELKLGAFPA